MKKNFASTLALSVFALAGFGACEQNPYPKMGGRLVLEEDKPDPVVAPFSIQVDSVVNCVEGKACSIPVAGRVPNGGKPILRFENLPKGAAYDEAAGIIAFQPDFDVVDVAKDPTQTNANFVVSVQLRSDADPIVTARRTFTISVKNVYRPFRIVYDNPMPRTIEGTKLVQKVTVSSDDFPNGPFVPTLKDQPAGTTVKTLTPNQFLVEFTPNHFYVNTTDVLEGGRYVKKSTVSFIATAPTGFSTPAQTSDWTIVDDRKAPFVSSPKELQQGPIVDFTIRAEDLNGERPPVIQVDTNVPFGRLTATRVETVPAVPGVTLPSTLFSVKWEDIPYDRIGQTHEISALICGPSAPRADTICVRHPTKVTITGNKHLPPLVNRASWPLSQLQYVKVGQSLRVPFAATDAENSALPVAVTVEPASMARVVSYANGALTVTPTATGIQQFSLKITSQFHQSTVEGFLFEALPSTWSDTVVLTGANPSTEAADLQAFLPRAEILSALYQLKDERSLKLRRTLIVTTSALATPNALPAIEAAGASVPNVLIVSPLAAMAGRLTTELRNFGIDVRGRLTGSPLTDYTLLVESGSGYDMPRQAVTLAGAATSESSSPAILDLGRSTGCRRLFSLVKTGVPNTPVGVTCKRSGANAGSLTAVGFEFSDLVLSPTDRAVVGSWMEKISRMEVVE
jgi:hypothetical protein